MNKTLSSLILLTLLCALYLNTKAQNNFIISAQAGFSLGNKITTDSWWIKNTKPEINSIYSINILKNTKQVMWGFELEKSSLTSQSPDTSNHLNTFQYHEPIISIFCQAYYKLPYKKGLFLLGATLGYSTVKITDIFENMLKSEGVIIGISAAYSYPLKKINLIIELAPRNYEATVYGPRNVLQEHYSVTSIPLKIGVQIPVLTQYFANKKDKKQDEDEE